MAAGARPAARTDSDGSFFTGVAEEHWDVYPHLDEINASRPFAKSTQDRPLHTGGYVRDVYPHLDEINASRSFAKSTQDRPLHTGGYVKSLGTK
jgi:hypothetical protein